MLGCRVRVVGVADVSDEQLRLAVGSDGLLATVGLQSGLVVCVGLGLGTVRLEVLLGGLDQDVPRAAINDDHVTGLDVFGRVLHRENRGDLERAGDDGRVRGAPTSLRDDTGDVLLVDVGRHRGGELLDDDNRVLGQGREVDDLLAQQICKKAGLDVGHIGRALAEELVVHLGEHRVVGVVGLAHGLLGAHAGVNGAVDRVMDALVLGKLDVGAHDEGSLLANTYLHALYLSVGLGDELLEGSLVALLLLLGILRCNRGERNVGSHSYLRDANTKAIRCIDTFEH